MDVAMPQSKSALRWATVKLLSKQRKYWGKRNQVEYVMSTHATVKKKKKNVGFNHFLVFFELC